MAGSDTLVVFARYPTPGSTKTRLAAAVGEGAAARLYEAFVRDLVGRFAAAPFDVRWAVAPPDPGFAALFGLPKEACVDQRGDDLGARMLHAFRQYLPSEDARCVLIGSDAPHLTVERVQSAFECLARADVVLGPALDGGYYLIGARRPHDVFTGIQWSVSTVYEDTLARATALGLDVESLPADFDVDEREDLDRLRRVFEEGSVRCPATQRALRGIPV